MTIPSPVPSAPDAPDAQNDRLAGEHTDFLGGSLADDAPDDPMALFDAWIRAAFARREEQGDLPAPTALVLSTVDVDADGAPAPRSRTVLLKGRDERGFVLYTNYDSAKGRELAAHPRAALLAPWYPMQRQVRIEGAVEQVSAEESDAYFAQRPRDSQLGAWASRQSAPIASREALEGQLQQADARFAGQDVPRPPHWGGYRVLPERIEFWQGRPGRLHDRILYTAAADGTWDRERLQP